MSTKILAAAALALFFASHAFASEPIGKVESLSGTATALGAGGESRTLAVGASVFLNDKLTTDAGSKLVIRFIDNTSVGQGESAEMVIDRYVFDPDNQSANTAAFKLLKGAFRFLTDQITKLNPEQFEVQATYGTIGIRGCELGFDVNADRDDVFVVGLTGNESILFNLNEEPGDGRSRTLLVREAGIAVTMSALEGFAQRRFDPAELDRLFNLTSPQADAGERDTDADQDSASADAGDGEATGSGEDESGDFGSFDAGAPSDGNADQTMADASVANADAAPADQVNDVVAEMPAADTREEDGSIGGTEGDGGSEPDSTVENGSGESSGDTASNDGGDDSSGNGDGDTPTSNFPITIPGEKSVVASGRGLDWSWDVWARDFTTIFEDGSTKTMTKYSIDSSGDFITADEQLAIATGSVLYNLAGNGDAASVVSYQDQAMLLLGSMSLYVTIGQGVSPTWQSYVTVGNNGGGSLNFSANGNVGMDGSLQTASIANYQLNAYGFQLGIPPGNPGDMVSGHLVGSGTGANPITGGLLKWTIDHPNVPSVNGVGGADLH